MRIRHGSRDGIRVMRLKGRLAGTDAEERLSKVFRRIVRPRTARLIVDLTEVDFVGVMVVHVFVVAHYTLRKLGGRMVLSGASEHVAQMITQMTNLEHPLELTATYEEAAASLLAPAPAVETL